MDLGMMWESEGMLSDKGSPRGFGILMRAVLVGQGRIEVPRGVGEWV
jgi:hypothetical protein